MKYLLSAGIVAMGLGLTVFPTQQVAAAGAACAAGPNQRSMQVVGTVIQVGKEPQNFQHMVIQDDKTNCRVVVLVENNDKPCSYLAHASITIPVARATSTERATFGNVDYMDKGGNEMFACN